MEFVAHDVDGKVVRYQDRKRYRWLAAFISPLLGIAAVLLYVVSLSAWFLFLPLVYAFVVIPLADALCGEDTHNPPDAIVPLLAQDVYYRKLLYVDTGLLYVSFAAMAWLVGTYALPWWAYLGAALGAGITSADAIFLGHELGHKKSKLDRVAAQIALGLVGYGHFSIEHNRGHHVQVATPEDSASARMGESVYRFALREIPGALTRSWRLEAQRLALLGSNAWSPRNEILQSWSLTAALGAALIALLGWQVAPFILLHHLYAWYGLTQANYVEHYGLLREKLTSGRYEPTQPKHSWNTNHIFSNLITFHLQRHSDHHANALRPYQALRDFADLPRLPSGYPGCFGLAMIPSLWFKVMDAKLLAWCDGDLRKVNIDPNHREALLAKYDVVKQPMRSPVTAVILADMSVLDLEATVELPVAEFTGIESAGIELAVAELAMLDVVEPEHRT
jgi:alkane 1-monooxygenase